MFTTSATTPIPKLLNETFLLLNESVFGGGAETVFFGGELDSDDDGAGGLNGSLLLLADGIANKTDFLFTDPVKISGVSPDGSGDELKPIHIATTIMFLSGVFQVFFFTFQFLSITFFTFFQILMGVFRLDFLSCYLSEQVMSGFVVGGCVHVFFSQMGDVLGIQLPQRSGRGYLYSVSNAFS